MTWSRYVLFVIAAIALAAPDQSTPASSPPIVVTVACQGRPELTTIRNTSPMPVALRTLSSLYRPYDGVEPFALDVTLAPGQTVTYQTGSGASGAGRLYGQPIYNDEEATAEGVRVETSVGTFVQTCGEPATPAASPAMATPALPNPLATPIEETMSTPVW